MEPLKLVMFEVPDYVKEVVLRYLVDNVSLGGLFMDGFC